MLKVSSRSIPQSTGLLTHVVQMRPVVRQSILLRLGREIVPETFCFHDRILSCAVEEDHVHQDSMLRKGVSSQKAVEAMPAGNRNDVLVPFQRQRPIIWQDGRIVHMPVKAARLCVVVQRRSELDGGDSSVHGLPFLGDKLCVDSPPIFSFQQLERELSSAWVDTFDDFLRRSQPGSNHVFSSIKAEPGLPEIPAKGNDKTVTVVEKPTGRTDEIAMDMENSSTQNTEFSIC
jgi:hypothetical protein